MFRASGCEFDLGRFASHGFGALGLEFRFPRLVDLRELLSSDLLVRPGSVAFIPNNSAHCFSVLIPIIDSMLAMLDDL